MALRTEIVDFIRLSQFDDFFQPAAVGQIAIVQNELEILFVDILEDMRDARAVERRRPADDAVNLVALRQQQFGEIRAVLAGHSRNQRTFHWK